MPINLLENANMDEWDRTVDVNCKVECYESYK